MNLLVTRQQIRCVNGDNKCHDKGFGGSEEKERCHPGWSATWLYCAYAKVHMAVLT